MTRLGALAVLLLAAGGAPRSEAAVDRLSGLRLPASITAPVLQALLQDFVNAAYGKGFARLGEEADFDHGHLLLDGSGKPIAVLFHTQELTMISGLDPSARNWIEWFDTHRVEDARRYERRSYPDTPSWRLFRLQRLPLLEARHTILDKMLDPALLGAEVRESRQWVFTRRPCTAAPDLRVELPDRKEACLALSAY